MPQPDWLSALSGQPMQSSQSASPEAPVSEEDQRFAGRLFPAIGQALSQVAGEHLSKLYDMATYPYHHAYPPSFSDTEDPRTQAAIGNAADIARSLGTVTSTPSAASGIAAPMNLGEMKSTAGVFLGPQGMEKMGISRGTIEDLTKILNEADDRRITDILKGRLPIDATVSDQALNIFRQTKGFQGAGGGTRMEFPDTGAQLVPVGMNELQLQHPTFNLHDLYGIPNIKRDLPASTEHVGEFQPGTGTIHLLEDYDPVVKAHGYRHAEMPTALHEIQHAIQQKEGFESGGNKYMAPYHPEFYKMRGVDVPGPQSLRPDFIRKIMETDPSRLSATNQAARERYHQAGFDVYRRLMGEQEAENVANRFLGGSYMYDQHPALTSAVPYSKQLSRSDLIRALGSGPLLPPP